MIELLKQVTQQLEHLNIDYMLSGSLALNFYTTPRMTRDIDIVIHLKQEQLDSFLALFQNHYYSKDAIQEALLHKTMFNILELESGFKLDFIVLKDLPFRQAEFKRRTRSNILGFPVWLVTIEDLIISKLLWIQELFSDRQADDLKHLLNNPQTDQNYLSYWINELHLNTHGLIKDA